ncbi:MAG: SPOR domain-containing protein [Bacteroidetes bacterium]|nr:MAG: SPOR domain-containing protein [Bacteroidota bacterium]
MKRFILLCCFSLSLSGFLKAQDAIKITGDPLIFQMMDRFVELNRAQAFIEGWRIQILATSDRQRVETAKLEFQSLYPNIPVDWIHSAPYYKLRAGAYASKLDAIRMLYILKKDYPTAYPVKDSKIRPDELIPDF